jgi:arsenite-transporting ATPase
MAPRTILYTGKGGVGKTSVAAATARRCAATGLRTVVMSTDPAHSLSDSLEAEIGSTPTEIAPNLFGQEVQAQEEMERHWDAVSDWMGELLTERGVDGISAEELTVPPGMDELFSLLQVKRHHDAGEFDVVVVDCAPTGETLRLLSFPDVCSWWLEKVFPFRGRIMAAARPLARTVLDMPLPSEAVFEDVERLAGNLVAMNAILRDRSTTSVRLVLNPDRMVVKEAMRTFTYLNLYGYLTDAIVVNRVLPEQAAGDYFADWRRVQQENMELVRSGFAPVPVLTAAHLPQEVMGAESLDRLGDELFDGVAAHEVLHAELSRELTTDGDTARLRLPLPFADRGDIDLKKVGLEVIVRVGPQKRTIILPPALAGHETAGARFQDGALEVVFERVANERPANHTAA